MELFNSLAAKLLSPMVLAFALGIFATLIKSDLKFPEGLYIGLTIYLLFAIGLKGGVKLSATPLNEFYKPALGAILMCSLIPIWSYFILNKIGKFSVTNAAAIAAHYGSVSAVTFSESLSYMETMGVSFEGFMPTMLAIMEVPAILIAIFIARTQSKEESTSSWGKLFHELFAGRGTVLLIGGLVIGFLSGKKGFEQVAPLFDTPFKGVLALFLLEVGLVTGRKLGDLVKAGPFLIGFGLIMPIVHACIGIYLGKALGLSLGGSTIFGVLCASASYIAAPAAIRIALPEASPTYYLTSALAITFPFNIVLGLPLYLSIAKFIFGVNS
ncbi:MAG: sodium-dependent bicarbonate transport family permease [Leptospiraceae bacterium]|nr:sodium-dependent bicarbonate transport family permease [Leptospiraceae bacterium]MBK7053748.1 sodium-dependent bicarbonate transport family permease [Leptospiraceae bacterium]MBK9500129.1 sodium-dependent bicarbonate transport family permease [Leptospiraceae bacterium]MBP9162849.1 sodium-dependent bicarbonate transport family permease [Leptospiraceae bacterium]HRG46343.1 sodium-dependent bicarbonate transport family permease [Leptospiraceae bacterium]